MIIPARPVALSETYPPCGKIQECNRRSTSQKGHQKLQYIHLVYAEHPQSQNRGCRKCPWTNGRKIQINTVAISNTTTGKLCQKHGECQQRLTQYDILQIISGEKPGPTAQYFCARNDGPPNGKFRLKTNTTKH